MSLIGYFRLNENAIDSSGNNHHGSPLDIIWEDGLIYKCASFDGTKRYIEFDDHITVNNSSFTVSAWIKPGVPPVGQGRVVCGTYKWNADSSLQRGWTLGYNYGSADHFAFQIYNDEGVYSSVSLNNFWQEFSGYWVHVVGVYDKDNYIKLILNNIERASVLSPGIVENSSVNFKIGNRPDNTTQGYWDGLIDNVRIYDHVLTNTEVNILYNLYKSRV